ncbi:MAG TPA: putative DNA-binding domain-containing protein [Gammaproteobacteria bacterium]
MSEQNFRARQYAFAAHLRNPQANAAPEGIEDRRLAIYRDLFFNNIQSLLAGTFPVLHRILGKDRWALLIRDFYHRHVSHTPIFMEIPQEFLAWLSEEFENDGNWPGFMPELAHYEWVELDVSVDQQEIDAEIFDPGGNLLDDVPVISPVARPLAYRYPVHRIGPDFQPKTPGDTPTFLVVYRKRDDAVGFTEINAVTARLLELLESQEATTGRALLTQIAGELGHANPDIVIQGGMEILESLKEQDVILGTRRRIQ